MGQTLLQNEDLEAAIRRKNRVYFVLGLALVLAIGGFFAKETIRAMQIRAATSSVFNQYVIEHHIGQAEVSDDASGFQGDFCVLHLIQKIPKAELEQKTLNLMQEYQSLDGGTSLAIQYNDSSAHKSVLESDAVYDAASQTVKMELNEGNLKRVVVKHVDWQDSQDAS